MAVRVISIGGEKPKVTTVGRRKIYTSRNTDAVISDSGNILSLKKNTGSSGGGTTREVVVDPKTGRELSPFEVSRLGGQTDAKTGQANYYETKISAPKSNQKIVRDSSSTQELKNATIKKPVSTVSPATKKEKFYQTKTGQFISTAKTYFLGRPEVSQTERIRSDAGTFPEKAGLVFGSVGRIAAFGSSGKAVTKTAATARNVIKPATTAYAKGLSRIPSGAGRFVTNLGVSTGVTYGVTKGASTAGQTVFMTEDEKQFIGSKGSVGLSEQAFRAGVARSVEGRGKVVSFASEIPIVDRLVIKKDSYNEGVRDFAYSQGLTGSQAETLISSANKYGKIRRGSFALGLTSANTFSEIGGQVAFSKLATKTYFSTRSAVKGLFGQGFKTIAPQGVIEGTSSVFAEQAASGRNLRTIDYRSVAIGGAVGGVGAGVIGGSIVASQALTSKTGRLFSKGLVVASNVADPYEGIGDSIAGTAVYPRTSSIVRTPGAITLTSTNTMTRTKTPTLVSSQSKKPSISADLVVNEVSYSTKSSVNKGVFSRTLTPTQQTVINRPAKTPTDTRTDNKLFTNPFATTNTLTGVSTNTFTPARTFTPTNTLTSTRTNTFVSTRTSVNARTNIFTKTQATPVPFLPLPKGGGFGGFKSSKQDFGAKFYTPSATASFFGIKGSKPAKSNIKSGLGFRPIISDSKSKQGVGLFGRSSTKF